MREASEAEAEVDLRLHTEEAPSKEASRRIGLCGMLSEVGPDGLGGRHPNCGVERPEDVGDFNADGWGSENSLRRFTFGFGAMGGGGFFFASIDKSFKLFLPDVVVVGTGILLFNGKLVKEDVEARLVEEEPSSYQRVEFNGRKTSLSDVSKMFCTTAEGEVLLSSASAPFELSFSAVFIMSFYMSRFIMYGTKMGFSGSSSPLRRPTRD